MSNIFESTARQIKRHSKRQLAKFGVFQIHESGADSLYASRDLKGKPLMTFSDAVALKQHFHDTAPDNNNLNLIVRSI